MMANDGDLSYLSKKNI